MINIKNLPKANVLMALFNATHQQGMGFLDARGSRQMTLDDAKEILATGQTYFDYLRGRVMKVNLSGDEFDPFLFDRDNYDGSAQDAIAELRKTLGIEESTEPARATD